MASPPLCLVTPRDRDLFQALDRSPLTVRQLLKLSVTFAYPFTTERRVQERLHRLTAAGRVRRWLYATAGRGALSYYTLAPLGYRLLHGADATISGRGIFGPVGVARQAHTQALAEAIVHLVSGAHRSGLMIENFRRENTLRLNVGEESLYPDAAFDVPTAAGRFAFFLELDNRTETVGIGASLDSWGRKVRFYERYQDTRPERFRVLLITTGGPMRVKHMLDGAGALAANPRRSLVYGVQAAEFLDAENPLLSPCFRNPAGDRISLIPPAGGLRNTMELTSEIGMVPSPSCLRPLARV